MATAVQCIRELGKYSIPEKRDGRIQQHHWTHAVHGMTPYTLRRRALLIMTARTREPHSVDDLACKGQRFTPIYCGAFMGVIFHIFVAVEDTNFQPQLATIHTRLPFTFVGYQPVYNCKVPLFVLMKRRQVLILKDNI